MSISISFLNPAKSVEIITCGKLFTAKECLTWCLLQIGICKKRGREKEIPKHIIVKAVKRKKKNESRAILPSPWNSFFFFYDVTTTFRFYTAKENLFVKIGRKPHSVISATNDNQKHKYLRTTFVPFPRHFETFFILNRSLYSFGNFSINIFEPWLWFISVVFKPYWWWWDLERFTQLSRIPKPS